MAQRTTRGNSYVTSPDLSHLRASSNPAILTLLITYDANIHGRNYFPPGECVVVKHFQRMPLRVNNKMDKDVLFAVDGGVIVKAINIQKAPERSRSSKKAA